MKTVFDKTTRDELTGRINALNENKTAQWGKMNVYQMLKHCTLWEEWIQSNKKNKQVFVGKLFGRMVLNSVLKDEKPLRHNTPTLPELIIKEQNGDMEAGKRKWIALIEKYADYSTPVFVHPFFGKMTREQVGYMAYKHTDHHLRQFGC